MVGLVIDLPFVYAQTESEVLTGKVTDRDGNVLENVEIIYFTPTKRAYIRNGVEISPHLHPELIFKSDQNGEFSIPIPNEPFGIYMVHEEGYAFFKHGFAIDKNEIALTEWSRITGNLSILGKEDSDKRISINIMNYEQVNLPRIFFDYSQQTDENGEFLFQHVIEGEIQVSYMTVSGNTATTQVFKVVSTKPGEQTNVWLISFMNDDSLTYTLYSILFFIFVIAMIMLIRFYFKYKKLSFD